MSKLIITTCLILNPYVCQPPQEVDYKQANCLFGGIMTMNQQKDGWITKVFCKMTGPSDYELWKERR